MKTKASAFNANDSLVLKGVAIIAMIFHHCFCDFSRFSEYSVDFSPLSPEFAVELSAYFKICVSIFAFISGYGLWKSYSSGSGADKDMRSWTRKRLFKTFSGYFFIYILVFVITLAYDRYPVKKYGGKGSIMFLVYALLDFLGLSNICSAPSLCATWWYMGAASFFIISVPIVFHLYKKVGFAPIMLSIIILPRVLKLGYPGGINLLTFLFVVVIGMVFAEYDIFEAIRAICFTKNRVISQIIKITLLVLILCLSVKLSFELNKTKFWILKYNILPVVFIIFVNETLARLPGVNRILAFFGKHSMNIFLTHTFIRDIYFKDFTYSFRHFIPICVVLFTISLFLSIIIDFAKKFSGYNKLIDKIFKFISNPRKNGLEKSV